MFMVMGQHRSITQNERLTTILAYGEATKWDESLALSLFPCCKCGDITILIFVTACFLLGWGDRADLSRGGGL